MKICLYMVGQLMAAIMPFYVEYVVQAPQAQLAFWQGEAAVAASWPLPAPLAAHLLRLCPVGRLQR